MTARIDFLVQFNADPRHSYWESAFIIIGDRVERKRRLFFEEKQPKFVVSLVRDFASVEEKVRWKSKRSTFRVFTALSIGMDATVQLFFLWRVEEVTCRLFRAFRRERKSQLISGQTCCFRFSRHCYRREWDQPWAFSVAHAYRWASKPCLFHSHHRLEANDSIVVLIWILH